MTYSFYFDSSAIERADYDDETRHLNIWFVRSPATPYLHVGVPFQIWAGLLNADSPGGFYNSHIRGEFSFW